MADTLNSISSLFRSLVSLVVLGLVGTGGWIGYQTITARSHMEAELQKKAAELEKLNSDLAESAKQVERLDLAVRLMKNDHRLAKITVLDQWKDGDRPQTKIQFVDIDDEGQPIDKPREFTIEGDMLHVQGLVVKYLDKFVESGDPVRGTSVCLLERLYGDYQEPSEGFRLDPVGSRPAVYGRGEHPSDREREIWANFWDFANDPEKAHDAGIRAAHGEGPFVKLRPGKTYIVEIRSSGGLTIKPEEEFKRDREQL